MMMLQGEGSPVAGAGMLLVLGYAIYWVVRSRRRIRTVLYALASVVAEIVVASLFAWLFPLYSGLIGIGDETGQGKGHVQILNAGLDLYARKVAYKEPRNLNRTFRSVVPIDRFEGWVKIAKFTFSMRWALIAIMLCRES
jgi:hypothetical protein